MPEMHMPSATLAALTVGRMATRIPGLRRLPVIEIVLAGQVLLLAREHLERLTPRERHRVVVLVRACHGRVSRLSARDRDELRGLIAKVEPRLFAETAVRTLSPLPLPGTIRRR